MKWHLISPQEAYKLTDSSSLGLTNKEANARRSKFGWNELEEKKQKSPLYIFLTQFKDFMVLILIAAAIISGVIGDVTDTIIIMVIVFLNATIGFIQEYRAVEAIKALKKLSVLYVTVNRNNNPTKLPANELVPGDIIFIESGNLIPADALLLEVQGLKVDESALSGESQATDKSADTLKDEHAMPGDQYNMVFKGTLVTHGRAKALVVSTGMNTELGKIAKLLQTDEMATPLQKRMADFGKKLTFIILGICALLFGIGIMKGEDALKMLLLATSLAVAAIPEALPALITIALALGAKRLVKQNALIRKLPAVETLGSVSFICSDKTGTLTLNKMQVVETWEAPTPSLKLTEESITIAALHLMMSLNHDVTTSEEGNFIGDPTEIALAEYVKNMVNSNTIAECMKQYKREAEIPFDAVRKCMTTIHQFGNQFLIVSKGAIESIGASLSIEGMPENAAALNLKWAGNGLRVLAYAYKIVPSLPVSITPSNIETDLTFAGLAGMMDPPRAEVIEAIKECRLAGITPIMITGDHPATAAYIAKEIGILQEDGITITGSELSDTPDAMFTDMVEKISVYARVSPEQKMMIVKTLQLKGHFVAMTGDGVNDAPTLKAADIGIAMGINGTDVSKEAAHMILLDDNFSTIVNAIKEGRRIYDNIRKFVKYIMTCNSAEILTILVASLIGFPVPLLPIHILWINLITDGLPGLALASEKAEIKIMHQPPRSSKESLFADGIGIHILWVSILMASVTLGIQWYEMSNDNGHWQTMVFMVLSLSQLGHVLAIRSEKTYLYKQGLFSNLALSIIIVATLLLQLLVIYLPQANIIFKTAPLTMKELFYCFLLSAVVFHAVEMEKWFRHHRNKKNNKPKH